MCAHDPLMESGVDSLAATELRNAIRHELGTAVRLPSTIVFDHPTAAAIAQFVISQLDIAVVENHTTGQTQLAQTQLPPPVSDTTALLQARVMGTWSVAPAMDRSNDVWRLMHSAANTVRQIPAQRFDIAAARLAAPELLYMRHGHFVINAQLLDNRLFRMSTAEVQSTDPTHRLLLEGVFGAVVQFIVFRRRRMKTMPTWSRQARL